MVTSGVLTNGIAAAVQIPTATINMFVRVLREERLITTGARGVNAPPMTYLDAARILIALLVTDRPARAAEAVRDFGSLECVELRINPDVAEPFQGFTFEAAGLEGVHTLEEAVATLIEVFAEKYEEPFFVNAQTDFADTTFLPRCQIQVHTGFVKATINLPGGEYRYRLPASEYPPIDWDAPVTTTAAIVEERRQITDEQFAITDKYFTKIQVLRSVLSDVVEAIALIFDPSKPDEGPNKEA